jgi:hypothetical protein
LVGEVRGVGGEKRRRGRREVGARMGGRGEGGEVRRER